MKTKFNGILTLILVLTVQFVFAQKTVTGSVTDENGPLPGVNIIIKGSKTGTETDFDGKYSITAKQGDILVFSYVGLKTVEKKVEGSVIDVVMETSDENVIDEVVVTAYGKKKSKNEFTGNAVNVDATQISKSGFVSSEQALQGKAAGVLVNTTSGTPGSGQQIRIRGLQSVNSSNAPLIVIDGVAISDTNLSGDTTVSSLSPLASLRNDDIETITILKDAISTAPYGPAGSNGVIMITTKSGKKGDAKFNFSSTIGFSNNARTGLTPMSGEQKYELVKEAVWNTYGTNTTGGLGYIATRDDVEDFMSGYSTFDNATNWNNAGKPDYNWAKEVAVENAPMINSNFSVGSGNEKSSFFASIGYNKSNSTIIGSDFSRLGGLFKFESKLRKNLNLKFSINGSNLVQNASLEQGAYFSNPNLSKYFLSPWISPYDENGEPNIGDTFTSSLHNTLYTTAHNIKRNDITKFTPNIDVDYEFYKNLTFSSTFGLEYNSAYYKDYANTIHGDGADTEGSIYEDIYREFIYTTQNSLEYKFDLGEKNHFNVTALSEFSKQKDYDVSAYGEYLANENITDLVGASDSFDAYSGFSDEMTLRYVGLLAYNYASKYLLDASYSYQGNSKFDPTIRFDHFYSVGLGWNIHNEDFLKDVKFINNLRLKASYGTTGNFGIDRNKYLKSFGITEYNAESAMYISSIGYPLHWETGVKRDLSLDYQLWDRRIKGTIAYFLNNTNDMLFNFPMGQSSQYVPGAAEQNVGEMQNKGIELELSVDVIKNDNFTWNMNGNYSTVHNMVTYLPKDGEIISATRAVQQDHMIYEWYMPVWAGVNPDNGLPQWYVDVNDETNPDAVTSTYTQAKKAYQGTNATPTYAGGFNTRFDYKNLFIEGGIYFAGGNQVYEDWAAYTHTSLGSRLYTYNASTQLYDGVWRNPGDNATHPRMEWTNAAISAASSSSTRYLYDGDYIRLKDLAIGYQFDKSFFNNLFFDSVSLTLRGSNLYTWVKDERLQWDPEVRQDGFTNLTTPQVKTISFNLSVNF